MVVLVLKFCLCCLDMGRSGGARGKERVPTRLSLSMRGAEGGSPEGAMDTRVSDSRLATPSSGGRMSFKGSGIPVPVGSSTDNAKLRRVMQDVRGQGISNKQRPL